MHTWAKRGIQTALITGGLLMLGTGIAAADEDVNPDQPASALDGGVVVPLGVGDNAVGTPLGPVHTPKLARTVEVRPARLPVARPDTAGSCATDCGSLRGNRVSGDLVVPVDVSGNAVALGGDACVTNTSSQHYRTSRPARTAGHGLLSGNAADLDWAAPVQVTGNAVGALGHACATSDSVQHAETSGDTTADGRGGTLAGNVLAGQGATPVQVTGNALAVLGGATSVSRASTAGVAGGWLASNGDDGAAAGNVGAVPFAVPVEVNGNAIGAAGRSTTRSASMARARSGSGRPGRWGAPTSVATSGASALLSGNAAGPALSGPVLADCDALTVAGRSDAACASDSAAWAGGASGSNGNGSTLSGNVVGPALAVPAEVFANPVAAGGSASSAQANAMSSDAGGPLYSFGDDGLLSGNLAGPSASGPVDVFTTALGVAGNATACASNVSRTGSGGRGGTSGSDALGGGNIVALPVSMPAEAFGTAGSVLGAAESHSVEAKQSSSGGFADATDPGGLGAANIVQGAVAGPAQVMGNGLGVLGRSRSVVDARSASAAGGGNDTSGTVGTASGNVGQAALALPAQVFGSMVTAGGTGRSDARADTTSAAGGPTTTDGVGGFGAGNVVSLPAGSAAQLFGVAGSALGSADANGAGRTGAVAGGPTRTTGTAGTLAGNVLGVQSVPLVRGFGTAVSGLGGASAATGENRGATVSGGDLYSAGDFGALAGNVVDVPVVAAVQPFGDAVSVLGGSARARGDDTSVGRAGGHRATGGRRASLSGIRAALPVVAGVPVYDVPVRVLADAMSDATNGGALRAGDSEPIASRAADGLAITRMPRLTERPGVVAPASPVPALPTRYLPPGALPAAGTRQPARIPALSGLDTARSLRPVELGRAASLADTRSRLATLFD
jgi:trimeric autotransporter adhesin